MGRQRVGEERGGRGGGGGGLEGSAECVSEDGRCGDVARRREVR